MFKMLLFHSQADDDNTTDITDAVNLPNVTYRVVTIPVSISYISEYLKQTNHT